MSGIRSCFFLCLLVFCAVVLPAQRAELSLRIRPSLFAAYHEQAGENFLTEPQEIWGDFSTWFADIDAGLEILPWLFLRGRTQAGRISPNNMYIGNEISYLGISGYVVGFDLGPGFRLPNTGTLETELGFSFSYRGGTKFFSDFSQDGTVFFPGQFGSYVFKMFGPDAWLSLGLGPWANLPLTISLRAHGSPLFENHSLVSGWSPDPKEEFAKGFRYGGFLSLGWRLVPDVYLESGWHLERMYYRSGELATHDLDILYSGPYLGILLRFGGKMKNKKSVAQETFVQSEADCRNVNAQSVIVIGKYRTMMLPKSARPGSPLFASDRIVIVLADGHQVAVETHEKGIRIAEEKEKYLDKKVKIRGTFRRFAQLWGSPEESAIVIDSLVDIKEIEIVP